MISSMCKLSPSIPKAINTLADILILGNILILADILILGGTQADWGQIDGSCCIVSTSNPAGVLYLLIPGYPLKGS